MARYPKAQVKRAERMKEFLAAYSREDVSTIKQALERVDLSEGTMRSWRADSRAFDNQVLSIKLEKSAIRESKRNFEASDLVVPISPEYPKVPAFREFRREYLGRPVAKHQEHLVEAWEDKTNRVVIMLGPPGMGKDTTAGDFLLQETAEDRNRRLAWMMESEDFSKRRTKNRLAPYLYNKAVYRHAPDGPDCTKPTRSLIDDYGPFKWEKGMRWEDGSDVERPTWNANEIYYINYGAPEADPNIWATGVDGSVYGSRIDTLYLSDPFTRENQSGSQPPKQRSFIAGTLRTRLDERGRLMVLGTRVRIGDNYEWMLDYFINDARIVYQSPDGQYTKYANGTATIIVPAIQFDAEGNEVSYWPDRFPLENALELADGTRIPESSVTEEEWDAYARQIGTEFIGGLLEMRKADPELFETIYQQNPPISEGGEFTDTVLDHCDDPSRSYGVYRPGELLFLSVDPARTAGAAYTVLAFDPLTETITVIDQFYGEKLGVLGIQDRLIMEPARQYLPRAMIYEINQQSAVLELDEIRNGLKSLAIDVVRHTTHQYNRNEGDHRVAAMVYEMRDGLIKFPAATQADRDRSRLLKQHFHNWDNRQMAKSRKQSVRNFGPDDLVMAFWIGWFHIRRDFASKSSRVRSKVRSTPNWIRKRRQRSVEREVRGDTGAVPPTSDLIGQFYEGADDIGRSTGL